jgi:hypothetical protein
MKKQTLVFGLIVCGLLVSTGPAAQAANPLLQSGVPGFRPAYLRSDGPQPFSTRRTRELQAARKQASIGRVYLFSGASSRGRSSLGISNSTRRSGIFWRRSRR